jgi:hypothetical protein
MNKDLDERIVPKGQYRDALNIQISTSDSDSSGLGNIGTVQNLKGNRQTTTTSATLGHDDKKSKIIASVSDEGNNKAYFFTAAPVPIDGIRSITREAIVNTSGRSSVDWIDSIVEVEAIGNGDNNEPVFVDKFAVTGTKAGIINTFPASPENGYLQITVLDGSKYRVGMNIYAEDTNGVNLLSDGNNPYVTIDKIGDDDGGNLNVLTLSALQTADLNTAVAFWFIHPERVLEFDYYNGDIFETINIIPSTSLSVLDNLLMWSDGKHEPKKINIDRSKAGTVNLTTHTKLYVNDPTAPTSEDPLQIDNFEMLNFSGLSIDAKKEHITVIKKAPLLPPNIEIKVSDRVMDPDIPLQAEFVLVDVADQNEDNYNVIPTIGDSKEIEFPDSVDFRIGDIFILTASNVVDPITIRIKITQIDPGDTGNMNLAKVELLFVDSDLTVQTNPENWVINLEIKKPFFEAKFGRFGYRYQYEDNEYSSFSPWSSLAFLPGSFEYIPSKGFNEGMSNTVRSIIVRDWLPSNYTRPLDVKAIDILWKTTDDANVYIVKTIKRNIDTEWRDMSQNTDLDNTGEFTLTSEMIHKVVEANQTLRSWDNVPRYARSQTLVSNRVVYGNYTQGYNIPANIGLLQTVVSKKGFFPSGIKSVKSLRNYQFGIVIGDKYGRETPVISNGYRTEDGTQLSGTNKVPKSLSSFSNKFKIEQSWDGYNPTQMEWMDYVKYYVKETSNEYYNLVLDRSYDAGDDNIWLAFNSADRNKVDEETYLILKNEHGSQKSVEEEARYKIIAIENDAPDYIKTEEKAFDLIEMNKTNVYIDWTEVEGDSVTSDAIPDRLINYKTLRSEHIPEDDNGKPDLEFKGIAKVRIVAQFTDSNNDVYEAKSPLRNVTRVFKQDDVGNAGVAIREPYLASDVDMYQRVLTQLPDASELPIATADTNNNFKYYLEFIDAIVENKPQFDGKFFVKIAKDDTLEARVLGNSLGEYQVLNTYELAFISDDKKNPAENSQDYAAHPGMDYEDSNWETIAQFTSSTFADEDDAAVTGLSDNGFPNFVDLNGNSTATDEFWVAWSNDANKTADIFIDAAPAYSGFNHTTAGGNEALGSFNLYDSYSIVDGDTTFNPRGLSNGSYDGDNGTQGQFIFSMIGKIGSQTAGPWQNTNSYFKSKMQTPGTLFRFRDDPNQEVYRVEKNQQTIGDTGEVFEGPIEIESKNFENDGSSHYVDRVSIIVRFARIGANGEAIKINGSKVGIDTSVWDPRGTVKHNGLGSMTVDIVKRVPVNSLTEDSIGTSAACFETEPKEDVGLDIYYEASGAVPVKLRQDNIRTFTGANKVRERASKFSVDPRVQNNYTRNVSIANDPFVWKAQEDDIISIKRGTVPSYLLPVVDGSTLSGDLVSIGDIVRFENKDGLVTKSKVLDHMKLAATGSPVIVGYAIPSDRYTISCSSSGAPPELTTTSGTGSNVTIGMEVTGPNITQGTFVRSITNLGGGGYTFSLTTRLNTEVYPAIYTASYTFIDTTGIYKIDKEVWKYSIELGWFNCYSFGNGVESDRIRDDFNAPQIDNGVKVSSTFLNYGEEKKTNGMIFSNLYNSTSGVNGLNEFNMAEKITKDINTTYGSIQAMYARDNDVVVFTEDKVLKVQSGGKDALFNADGNAQLTATNRVLGTSSPFAGDYGISKNPQSLAVDSYRMYFTDKQRGAVLRLSGNGITPISDAGMKNYFRENLKFHESISGSFDGINDEYNLTLHDTTKFSGFGDKTISFNEKSKGWISFKSFTPLTATGFADRYYSVKDNTIWKHYSDIPSRNSFYGTTYNSEIEILFSDAPNAIKSFKNINYEGSQAKVDQFTTYSTTDAAGNTFTVNDQEYYNLNVKSGWYVESITTNEQTGSIPEFIEKEGKWFNYIIGDTTVNSNLDTSEFSVQGIGRPLINPTNTQTESEITIQPVDADGESL